MNMTPMSAVFLVLLVTLCQAYVEKPGPKFKATVGHPWPLPKHWTRSDTLFVVNKDQFEFRIVDETCDILKEAIKRYSKLIKRKRVQRHDQHETPNHYVVIHTELIRLESFWNYQTFMVYF